MLIFEVGFGFSGHLGAKVQRAIILVGNQLRTQFSNFNNRKKDTRKRARKGLWVKRTCGTWFQPSLKGSVESWVVIVSTRVVVLLFDLI